jgi:hypothetical protein
MKDKILRMIEIKIKIAELEAESSSREHCNDEGYRRSIQNRIDDLQLELDCIEL